MRAVAVLAVLLFHLEVPGFNGGYLGVGLFFVISAVPTLHLSDAFRMEAPVGALAGLSPMGLSVLGLLLVGVCAVALGRRAG